MQRELYLYAQESSKNPMIFAVQGDTARNLKCHFPDIDVATEVTSARIYIEKPDGTQVYNNCAKNNDGTITAPLTSQSLAAIGKAKAQIQLTGSSGYITTYEFIINVLKTLINPEAIESTDEWGALEYLLDKAGAYVVQHTSEMTDTTKTYYVADTGYCYVYDGTEWVIIGVPEEAIEEAIQEIVTEMLTDYARIDGYYEGMAVGVADNLIDRKGQGTLQEFVRRASGGESTDLADEGRGIIESIRGKTLAFNQLAPTGYSKTGAGSTAFTQGTTITAGHKYLLSWKRDAQEHISNMSVYTRIEGTNYLVFTSQLNATDGLEISSIVQASYSGVSNGTQYAQDGNVWLYQNDNGGGETFTDLCIIDLTKMFGAGNEPSTVAEFEALFPESYYPYNKGTFINFYGMKNIKNIVYDEITARKIYRRVGGVDLGDLEWHAYSSSYPNLYYAEISDKKDGRCYSDISGGYTYTANWATVRDNNGYYHFDDAANRKKRIYVNDNYTTVDALTTAVTGTILYYELATVVETDVTLNLTYRVADFGTETVEDGKLISNGFNQWNEQWERGYYDSSTGEKTGESTTRIRSKNHIPVFPGLTYYFCNLNTSTQWINICMYDADKNFVSSTSKRNTTYTIPDGIYYINIYVNTDYGSVYLNDICINFSWSGYHNGEYEAYWESILDMHIDDYFTDDNPTGMPYAPFNAVIKYNDDFTRKAANAEKNFDTTDGLDNALSAIATALSTALGGTFTITRGTYDAATKAYPFTASFTAGGNE